MAPVGRDPVPFWLSRVGVNSRPVYSDALWLFLRWLNARPDWKGADANALLEMHRSAKDQEINRQGLNNQIRRNET